MKTIEAVPMFRKQEHEVLETGSAPADRWGEHTQLGSPKI
jgi:hypothetical protein